MRVKLLNENHIVYMKSNANFKTFTYGYDTQTHIYTHVVNILHVDLVIEQYLCMYVVGCLRVCTVWIFGFCKWAMLRHRLFICFYSTIVAFVIIFAISYCLFPSFTIRWIVYFDSTCQLPSNKNQLTFNGVAWRLPLSIDIRLWLNATECRTVPLINSSLKHFVIIWKLMQLINYS